MPRQVENIKGMRFGKLVVNWYVGGGRWCVTCDCGRCYESRTSRIKEKQKCAGCAQVRHGHNKAHNPSKTYMSWQDMKKRCQNPNEKMYQYYGGRGISVCQRWQKFENFLADMGECPEGYSIEREDSNGDYEPGNCAWIPRKDQSKNRRGVLKICYNNKQLSLAEAAALFRVDRRTVSRWYEAGKLEGYRL